MNPKHLLILIFLVLAWNVGTGFTQENGYLGRFEWVNDRDAKQGFRVVLEWPTQEDSILVKPPKIPVEHPLAGFPMDYSSSFSGISVQGIIFHFSSLKDFTWSVHTKMPALIIEYENSLGGHSLTVEIPPLEVGFNYEAIALFSVLTLILVLLIMKVIKRPPEKSNTNQPALSLDDLKNAFDRKEWDRFFHVLKQLPISPITEFDQSQIEEMDQKFRFTGTPPDVRQVEKLARDLRKTNQEDGRAQEEDAILREVLEELR